MANCYATLADLKTRLGIAVTTYDSVLAVLLEAASREIDGWCGRHFYTATGVRYFDSRVSGIVFLDDFLSLSALATDSESDGTFDGEAWTQGEAGDYVLWPDNTWPKMGILAAKDPTYNFATAARYLKATGVWGHGDGASASPWLATAITGTIATVDGLTLTLSAEGTIKVGQTILCESEQMYVSAVTSDASKAATVTRGQNGTTAATHTTKTLSVAQYPSMIVQGCLYLASEMYQQQGREGLSSEGIGDYRYSLRDDPKTAEFIMRILGPLRRAVV